MSKYQKEWIVDRATATTIWNYSIKRKKISTFDFHNIITQHLYNLHLFIIYTPFNNRKKGNNKKISEIKNLMGRVTIDRCVCDSFNRIEQKNKFTNIEGTGDKKNGEKSFKKILMQQTFFDSYIRLFAFVVILWWNLKVGKNISSFHWIKIMGIFISFSTQTHTFGVYVASLEAKKKWNFFSKDKNFLFTWQT